MRRSATILAAALALALALPAHAEAQGRGKRERDRDRDRDRGAVVTRDGMVIRPGQQEQGRAEGPAFCKSGAGHPVHGRQWCLEKRFGLGRSAGSWGSARMGDIVFGSTRRNASQELNRRALEEILGGVVLDRLDGRSRALGAREPLSGRWLPGEGRGHTLFVRAGGIPVAELVDSTGNGRVDTVLLNLSRNR